MIYLRAVQGILPTWLRDALLDLFGLSISEGALVNVLSAGAAPFKAAVSLIKARLLGGTTIASDETGVGSAARTGGCGCSTTATAPCWSSTPIARRPWWRSSWATTGPTSGCQTASAPRRR